MGIEKFIGKTTAKSVTNIVNNSSALINDVSGVYNLREAIYQRKMEILKSDMLKEVCHILFADVHHPPREIRFSTTGVNARMFEKIQNCYQIYTQPVYEPEHPFDYTTACAVCLLIQDMYKKVYKFPSVTTGQLQPMLEAGTWTTTLQMNGDYIGKSLEPAFVIDDVDTASLESLPIEVKDPKGKGAEKMPFIGLVLGVVSILLCQTPFTLFFSIAGIILGVIGLKTGKAKKISSIAVGVSAIGIALPFIMILLKLLSLF